MHPLDGYPDWSRPQWLQLRDLLVLAYEDEQALRRVAKQVGIVPGTFPGRGDVRSTTFDLIEVLAKQKLLRAFVQIAADDPAIRDYHDRLRELLDGDPIGRPSGGPPPVWQTTADDLVVIQRQRLLVGRDRLFPVRLAGEIGEAARSVAQLTVLFGATSVHGTGFLIADRLLLTAYHNLLDAKLGTATRATANFDYDGRKLAEQFVCEVDPAPVAGDPDADWAVLRIRETTGRKPLKLGSRFMLLPGNPLVIIQHPGGAEKRFAFDHQAVAHVGDRYVQYLADTMVGSSGSPVCNEGMEVIAIHQCDVAERLMIDDRTQTVWHNQGLLVNPIMAELERVLTEHGRPGSDK
ncbi:serine protease [Actinoplanes hulinensis]|uniref:Serine protease n=1 Tax=Actinoplanes hulinensis TaxID=1144547 RepID=A0ABS7B897_9ACTN|nr:serine protease [Actinoplanes hulinensis]MBW6437193.1 serine protease [Actinoplanes hulinensis]